MAAITSDGWSDRTLLTLVSEPPRLTKALSLWVGEVSDHSTFALNTAVAVHLTFVCTQHTRSVSLQTADHYSFHT